MADAQPLDGALVRHVADEGGEVVHTKLLVHYLFVECSDDIVTVPLGHRSFELDFLARGTGRGWMLVGLLLRSPRSRVLFFYI